MNQTSDKPFVISRVFDAPRDLVWKAFTEVESLKQWWGPKGFTMETATLDLRPGGVFHYDLRSAGGNVMWGKFVYREIVPPERIVYVSSFSDEAGGTARAFFSNDFPLEILNTLTLSEQDGKTTATLSGGPINATETQVRFFEGMFDSMRAGFGGTFDQLDAFLKAREGPGA